MSEPVYYLSLDCFPSSQIIITARQSLLKEAGIPDSRLDIVNAVLRRATVSHLLATMEDRLDRLPYTDLVSIADIMRTTLFEAVLTPGARGTSVQTMSSLAGFVKSMVKASGKFRD